MSAAKRVGSKLVRHTTRTSHYAHSANNGFKVSTYKYKGWEPLVGILIGLVIAYYLIG